MNRPICLSAIAIWVGALGLLPASASALDITLEVKRPLAELIWDFGDTFEAVIHIDYDGHDPENLTGIFVSVQWDPSVVQLTNATSPDFFILYDPTRGLLSKLSDPFNAAGDPEGTIRAVSYGAAPSQTAGAGAARDVTRLDFEFIGAGDVFPAIVLLRDDGVFADGLVDVTDSVNFRTIFTPEPSTALLVGMGLLGLTSRRTRDGRRCRGPESASGRAPADLLVLDAPISRNAPSARSV